MTNMLLWKICWAIEESLDFAPVILYVVLFGGLAVFFLIMAKRALR